MADEDKDDKTEEPTSRRLEKAREEGDIPRSRELTSLLLLLAGLLIIRLCLPMSWEGLRQIIQGCWQFDLVSLDERQLVQYFAVLLPLSVKVFLPIGVSLWGVAIIATIIIGGVNLSARTLQLKFSRLNPLTGMKKFCSAQTAAELVKSSLKAIIVLLIVLTTLWVKRNDFLQLIHQPLSSALDQGETLLSSLWLGIVLGMIPMVGFDIFWQLHSYHKKLRMTRQEIKEEHKQQEGDPHVKGRIRQQMRAAARRRMMNDVPNADVILTNPSHFAVALLYREGKMHAPLVVAKGRGNVALNIRKVAGEHRVPTLEAPPLARALWRHAEIGEPIPGALYTAVAEVLAWVWQVRRWRKFGGDKPLTPQHVAVPAEMEFDLENNHEE